MSIRSRRILAFAAAICATTASRASAQCQSWTAFPNGPNAPVYAMLSHDDGSGRMLYIGGDFNGFHDMPPQLFSDRIARWNGSVWLPVGWPGFNDVVRALTVFDSGNGPELYAGGWFTSAGVTAYAVARWDGSAWTSLPSGGVQSGGSFQSVEAMAVYDDGSGDALFLAGRFTGAGALFALNIVKFTGTNYSALGSGLGPMTPTTKPKCMVVHDDGSGPALIVGGRFATAGGLPVNNIAKWNGSNWSALGPGLIEVDDMVSFDDGSGPALYVAGVPADGSHVGVLKWDGSTWTPVGDRASAGAYTVDVFDDGTGPTLYMGGYFTAIGSTLGINKVARWDGQVWRPLGFGLGGSEGIARAMAVHDDGTGSALYFGSDCWLAGTLPSYAVAGWRACTEPIDVVCFGDGSVTACPCAPHGALGRGCRNSAQASGARLDASGSPWNDTLAFQANSMTPNTVSLYFQGDARQEAYQGMAFGDGLRCAVGQQRRLYTKFATGGMTSAPEAGDPSVRQRANITGDALPPGAVRYYQALYRDPNPTFCQATATWNLTNGVRVVW